MDKSTILQNIRNNKPADRPLPDLSKLPTMEGNLTQLFIQMAEGTGTRVFQVKSLQELPEVVNSVYPDVKIWTSTFPELPGSLSLEEVKEPLDLQGTDLAIIKGHFGVAENAAIWVTEAECGQRVLPFITEHLLIVVDADQIVPHMHAAYKRIKIDETGFGVFIAGPSKTADIEQSLVIGAQGARSLTVVLLGGEGGK